MVRLRGVLRAGLGLIVTGIVLAACSVGGTTGAATPTAPPSTPTATPCATRATTTATAWVEKGDKQIHGAIGGGGAGALSAFTYPLAAAAPSYVDSGPGSVSIAPDGKHLAVLQVQFVPNSDAPPQFILFVVDTNTHTVTRLNNVGTRAGLMGWADSKTLLYAVSPFWPSHAPAENVHFVDINSRADTTIPEIKQVVKAEVRCSTLFWSEYTPASGIGKELLHRYDLVGHAAIGSPFDLGTAFRLPSEFAGPDSIVGGGGWDVSVDGRVLAWQKLGAVSVVSGNPVIASSQLFKGNPDGSGAVAVLAGLPVAATKAEASLALSPDAAQLALSSGGVLASGALAGGGIRTYTPTALSPEWLPSSAGFLADNQPPGGSPTVYQYSTGAGAGALAHANAYAPDVLN